MPRDYIDSEGNPGQLSGKPNLHKAPDSLTSTHKNWTTRKHPDYDLYTLDEDKQRATYLATTRHLSKFLVPHRFEGEKKGQDLRRARYGYGIGLNKAYLADILGHVRSTATEYWWGPLGTAEDQQITGSPSEETFGHLLWRDATADDVEWKNFFEGTTLEWILTSPGGFVLVDIPPGEFDNLAAALAAGKRPFMKWIPMSWVWDYGRGPAGYKWIKLSEIMDVRVPNPGAVGRKPGDTGLVQTVVLYELLDDGSTNISRWDLEGNLLNENNIGVIVDAAGQPTLPLIPAKFGEHPDFTYLGTGVLMGLDDIVIDLYNLVSETREAYRDVAFGLLAYRGQNFEEFKEQMQQGTRLANLGPTPDAQVERVAAEATEVEAGLKLIEMGISAWALAARRKAADAQMEQATARSGIALQAEFQLDLKPLLVSITETLDAIETQSLFIVAQLFDIPARPADLQVVRDTEFQLEGEADRISRIVMEFMQSMGLPAEAKVQIVMRWLEHSKVVDLEEEVEMEGGAGRTMREVLEEQAREMFAQQDEERTARSRMEQADVDAMDEFEAAGSGGEE